MKRALITGGGGFIGWHLGRLLHDLGWSVDLLDNFSRGQRDSDLEDLAARDGIYLREYDLADPSSIEQLGTHYTEIFHFAAILGVQNVSERPFEVLDRNNALTVSALEIARRQSALGRFVFASTSEVYAGTLEQFDLPIPTPESAPLALSPLDRPRTSYALSKIYGEALSLHSGLPVTIVRPHNIYGPRMGMSHVIPQLLERGFNTPAGKALEVFSPDHRRTFCYVADAVEMIARLAVEADAIGRSVNVGAQGPEISIRELAENVIAVLSKNLIILPGSETPGSPTRRAPDMSLCKSLTGYEAQVSVKDGIDRSFAWYRNHVFAPARRN